MLVGKRNPINIPSGINKDDNALTSLIYTDAKNIRFYKGFPETNGGHVQALYNNLQTLSGVPRTIFNYISSDGVEHILIGTHTRLYTFEDGNLYNITPLSTTSTAIPNSLATNWAELATNPISTTNGSTVVGVAYSPLIKDIFRIGDFIKISGVIGTIGGISFTYINGIQTITGIDNTNIYFTVAISASSTASGGGSSAILSTQIITVTQTAHGFLDEDRIKIRQAMDFGGFVAADLNIENIIRYINANTYSYYLNQTVNFAISSVTSGGGALTEVQGQIPAGNCTFSLDVGYGGGPYGAGPYGTGKAFIGGYELPRIWSIDRYSDIDRAADGVVLTPGDQGKIYEWYGDLNTAPTQITGSPGAVNYVFVGNNQIISFGDSNIVNRVKTSDGLSKNNWTPGPTSTAFQGEIQGAGRLITHSYVKNQFLLFTLSAVYKMYYVGKPGGIWVIEELTTSDGILSPRSVIQLGDAVAWAGQNDFYIYNGSVLSQIPNNNLKQWFLTNINSDKYYLSFARRVIQFNEIRWFFAAGNAAEPDTQIVWNYQDGIFFNDSGIIRTASEEPQNPVRSQYLATGSCDGSIPSTLYEHEVGYSDNLNNMKGYLYSNYASIGEGDLNMQLSRIIPSNQLLPIGSINTGQSLYNLTINSKYYDGHQNPIVNGPFFVNGFTEKIDTRVVGRQRQYVYNFDGQQGFRIQITYEEIKPSTIR